MEEYTLWVTSEVKTHIALYIQVPVARSLPVSTVRSLHAWLYVFVHMCPYFSCVHVRSLSMAKWQHSVDLQNCAVTWECHRPGSVSYIACWGKRDLRSLAWCLYTPWVGLDNGMWWYLCILYCILLYIIYNNTVTGRCIYVHITKTPLTSSGPPIYNPSLHHVAASGGGSCMIRPCTTRCCADVWVFLEDPRDLPLCSLPASPSAQRALPSLLTYIRISLEWEMWCMCRDCRYI